MTLAAEIITLFILIVFSGFFSSVETAFVSLSNLRVKHLVKKGVKGANTIDKLKQNQQRLLITILVGNNVVNVGASAIATSITMQLTENNAIGIATGVMTLILLIFGEITPKSIATRFNQQIALLVAKPMQTLQFLLFPIVIVFEGLATLLMKIWGKNNRPLITEDELKSFTRIAEEIGQIEWDEKQMINRVFKLNDLTAEDVMTPLEKVKGVSINSDLKDVINLFYETGHSGLMVYQNDIQNVKGFIHVLDSQKMLHKNPEIKVKKIVHKIPSISVFEKLDIVLRILQRRKKRMAVVMNGKKVVGLITAKDILEEIVGRFMDETEKLQIGEHSFEDN